jgi:hypothetical protein
MSAPDLKIGSIVYHFDQNHRVYEDDKGNKTSSPNYRKYFIPLKIESETKQSWITQYGYKVPKKGEGSIRKVRIDTRGQFHGTFFLTNEAVQEDIWMHDHKYKIQRALENVWDVTTLKKVAEIIGYKGE